MKQGELLAAVALLKQETASALRTVYDALNQGQKKKILKNEAVAALFERYGVGQDE